MKRIQREEIVRVTPDVSTGLSAEQVSEREKKGYKNVSSNTGEKSTASIIFGNVFTFFNTILLVIAGVFLFFIVYLYSIGRGDVVDAHFGFSKFIFLIPAIMNVTIGTIQELHSRKVIKSLRIVTEAKSKVVRDGSVQMIDASSIVIDDIVSLSAGDQATADLVVVSGEVSVDESMLTGESDYIKKYPGDTILSGSAIIIGEAKARVVEIGDDTYASKLSKKVKGGARHKSELMTTIFKIMKFLAVMLAIVSTTVIVTLVLKIQHHGADASVWDGMTLSLNDPVSWARIMITGGSFGIGIIPSGLVLTTSVALMLSIVSLSKKNTLIQELYSLENLSRVDVICLDKTGTLTDGTMNVCDVKCFDNPEIVAEHAKNLMGTTENRNQTAEAIYKRFGAAENVDVKEIISFSSDTKSSGLVYNDGRKLLMGAPEYLLPKGDERLAFVSDRAKEGKRVIALVLDGQLLAFFVIEDHIRETAKDTLAFFRENGVTVKVISGDNPLTVSKIAQLCGVENADKYISLEGFPLEKIPEIAEEYTIFARVSPEQKEALVSALQANKHKVAMTGDGVNDILALRKADSSITFAKATEAAKSCADVVLLDNDFSHLKDVVGEGRRVIGNIQRTSVLYLMKAIAVIIFAFGLIPFAKGQMWFSVENVYMLEAAVIGTGGFLLSLEPRRTPVKGSFIKNINRKALAAGALAAIAIIIPIMMYTIPKYYGGEPLISPVNIRAMMTILMTTAGITVVLSMCIPFNKYRVFTLVAVIAVTGTLGLMLPTSYIGGNPMGGSMFAFDAAAGQTIFDSTFFREFFQPWNAQVYKNIAADSNNYTIIRIFLFLAVPMFLLVMQAIDRKLAKENGDFVPEHKLKAAGKMLLLISSIALVIQAGFMSANIGVEYLRLANLLPGIVKDSSPDIIPDVMIVIGAVIAVMIVLSVMYFIMSLFGYKTWKDLNKKNMRRSVVAAMIMLIVLAISVSLTGVSGFSGGVTELMKTESANTAVLGVIDGYIGIVTTSIYILGAIFIWIDYERSKKAAQKA